MRKKVSGVTVNDLPFKWVMETDESKGLTKLSIYHQDKFLYEEFIDEDVLVDVNFVKEKILQNCLSL